MTLYTNLDGLRSINRYTVNRSPFVSKKSRDQLEYREHRKKVSSNPVHSISIISSISFVRSINGMQMSVLRHELHDRTSIIFLWHFNGTRFQLGPISTITWWHILLQQTSLTIGPLDLYQV